MIKTLTSETYNTIIDLMVHEYNEVDDPKYQKELEKMMKNVDEVYLQSGVDTDTLPL